MKYSAVLSALVFMGPIVAAHAEAPSTLARQHLEAIGGGDVAKITNQYTADSWLNWVGGPLNGTYIGPQRLAEAWGKFTKSAPLKVTVGDMKESGNPAGTTVTANVIFAGKTTIKVRYVMLYRADHLVDEVWQIDPKLPG